MCHPTDSRPPAPPRTTSEVASHGPLELEATDGLVSRAYRAEPTVPTGSSVIILPDIRGIHPYYEALACRFAELGFHSVAVDFYGRTAGPEARGDDFDEQPHFAQLTADHVDADVSAAAALLRSEHPGPLFTVGFCLGGGHSWRQATRDLDLAGSIGFYGPPRFFGDGAEAVSAPLLMLLAGDDVATPQSEFQAMADRLSQAGKHVEMHVYEGAPHSFFDRGFDQWDEACADAWSRVVDFTTQHAR